MCGINPLEYNVVVKPRDVEEVTAGGLIIPKDAADKAQHAEERGTIVAMSPLAFNYDETAPKPALGATVTFVRYSGTTVEGDDGVEYRVMKDKDILAEVAA